MTIYYGATHDLEHVVRTHLFVISLNHGGSTYLKTVLASSRRTWNLQREGVNTFGFAGPVPRKLWPGRGNLWASQPAFIQSLRDASAYHWPTIRAAWYFQAFSHDPLATVFTEKSPSFLVHVDHLQHHFTNAKFLFMVRDPYAIVEGIRRSLTCRCLFPDGDELLQIAAHVIACLQYQRSNIETYSDQGIFFSYETLCATPETVEARIKELVPELDDLIVRQRLKVKNYDEDLRDMNEQQIQRLSRDDLGRINEVFGEHQALLNSFGYTVRS